MARQTGSSLKDLVEILDTGHTRGCKGGCYEPGVGYPIGLVANEIAEIMMGGGEDARQAEEELAKLLSHSHPNARYIAYGRLSMNFNNLLRETKAKLSVFEEKPENEKLVNEAKRRIAELS